MLDTNNISYMRKTRTDQCLDCDHRVHVTLSEDVLEGCVLGIGVVVWLKNKKGYLY